MHIRHIGTTGRKRRKSHSGRALSLLVCLLMLALAPLPALGGGGGGHGGAKAQEKAAAGKAKGGALLPGSNARRKKPSPLDGPDMPPEVKSEVARYCWNIADAARDARYLRQKRKLEEMTERLETLIKRLERKRAEYETWVKRREDITRRMSTSMMRVYEKMEPDVAAQQITHMEYAVAVALLAGMKPEKAAAILAEMDPKIAGRLVNVIVGRVAQAGEDQPGQRLLQATRKAAEETN